MTKTRISVETLQEHDLTRRKSNHLPGRQVIPMAFLPVRMAHATHEFEVICWLFDQMEQRAWYGIQSLELMEERSCLW